MTSIPQLSVLDLIPVRSGQTTGEALRASTALAQVADQLDYRRYWVAEHHNTVSVASTNPPVLIAMLASATEQISVGSGGVMLPNHSPLVVAEQFALLEAAFPGRIDLGIGRAPGTDALTRFVLRGQEMESPDEAVNRFPEYVSDIAMLLRPEGVEMAYGSRRQSLRATPLAASVPRMWLLGSSDYSARLAAQQGLPYVFAHHFFGQGTAQALELYRANYQPSEAYPEPRTFLTLNASVAETEDEAFELATPHMQSMIALRTGGPFNAQRTVEEAVEIGFPMEQLDMVHAMRRSWIIDEPTSARERIAEFAYLHQVDEVMVQPIGGARAGDPIDRTPSRETTLRLLAG
ncbi:LLM class flavin-dependent oxidoreductase [Nocardioides daphniae]|uniref:Alkanal monooxygenase subunit alpha n=1 Tax=Nocardioides daphniae TaxID=402297 RepID=A0ABQ1Q542_9ACTN|nr:LLM class flavin-dependent oxidoreductase [Nocardioides daphniae]GGD12940.1 alkanal monooxygenase subunit alpha [Nocardioides daphniae]